MKNIILFIIILTGVVSCSHKKENRVKSSTQKIDTDTAIQNYEMLADTVIYSLSLDMLPNKSPIFKNFNKNEFLDSLIFSATKGRVKAYDFFDHAQLTTDEVKENLEMVKDTLQIVNPETGDTTIKVTNGNFELSNVREVLFIEKWFWDKKTKQLRKQIIAYGPVIYDVKDDSTASYPVLKKVPFIVFNK
jgi:hypothetical protein